MLKTLMPAKAQLSRERNKLLRRIESALEVPMILLGFIWLILLVIELIWGLSSVLNMLSIAIWIVFITDFVLKFTLAPVKKTFLKKNWLTAISLIIPALRIIRVLRFVRVFRSLRGLRLVKVIASLNRSMNSLAATMKRRAFGYVLLLTLFVIFAGSAGMYAFEHDAGGFKNYGGALWWTSMLLTSLGSEYWPVTPEGRVLCFLLAIYGFAVFGYFTATLATFFIGREAEEKNAPVAGSKDIEDLRKEVQKLTEAIHLLQVKK